MRLDVITIQQRNNTIILLQKISGDDLLFRSRMGQVPSALASLTSEFEMGSGVTPPLKSPKNF